jgi:hypothetical protein
MKIYSQTRSGSEVFQHLTEARSSAGGGFAENQGIVRILQDGAGNIRGKRVGRGASSPGLADHTLEHISHEESRINK